MAAVRPVTQDKREIYFDEQSVRYGILMGGPKSIEWSGVGEFSVGHHSIPRRALAEFTSIRVGRRNEFEEALTDDRPSLHDKWSENPNRVISKSPKQCAHDVTMLYGYRGFVVPKSLIGIDFEEAVSLFDSVLPVDAATQPLVDVIDYLSVNYKPGTEAEELRNELLEAAGIARGWLTEYTRSIKGELDLAKGTGKGKRGLDEIDKEYFRELREPLPEEIPALATLSMGKQIGQQFATAVAGSKTDELVAALVEQNRLHAEEIRFLKERKKEKEEKFNDNLDYGVR